MATDLERLVVSLEANIKKYENSLAKAMQQTNTQAGRIEKRFRDMNKKVGESFDFGGTATRALGALGLGLSGAASLRAVSAAAQEFTSLQNALKVTGLEGEALDRTFRSLFDIAQRNGTAIAPLTTLYSRAAQAQKELNASSADLLKFTDGISTALRVAGTDSTQAAGALLQLSQAIGGGVVRAEEFNSVNEGARPILQAVAAGLQEAGGSVSKLKTLVNEGKVSSEAFFRAFLAGMPLLEQQAARADSTIGQASERIKNAFVVLVGQLDKTTGASSNAARNLEAVGRVLQLMPSWIDSASQKLDGFSRKMTEIGNSSVWAKIGRLLGAPDLSTLTDDQARALGLTPVGGRSGTGRIAEGANDPLGRAPANAAAAVKPVSLSQFKLPGSEDAAKQRDSFQRAIDQANKRIEVLKAETAVIDQGTAARERARLVAELEVAAKAKNRADGLKDIEVTAQQRDQINQLADAMFRTVTAAEAANGPLAQFAREAANTNLALQDAVVGGLHEFEDALVSIIDGTKSVKDAFRDMASAILADLARIAIRQAITGPIAGALGGLFGGGTGSSGLFQGGFGGQRAAGGPVDGNRTYLVGEKGPELFVPNKNGIIVPNHAMAGMGGGVSAPVNVTIDARGADAAGLARVQTEVARLRAELPATIVRTVRESRSGRQL